MTREKMKGFEVLDDDDVDDDGVDADDTAVNDTDKILSRATLKSLFAHFRREFSDSLLATVRFLNIEAKRRDTPTEFRKRVPQAIGETLAT